MCIHTETMDRKDPTSRVSCKAHLLPTYSRAKSVNLNICYVERHTCSFSTWPLSSEEKICKMRTLLVGSSRLMSTLERTEKSPSDSLGTLCSIWKDIADSPYLIESVLAKARCDVIKSSTQTSKLWIDDHRILIRSEFGQYNQPITSTYETRKLPRNMYRLFARSSDPMRFARKYLNLLIRKGILSIAIWNHKY